MKKYIFSLFVVLLAGLGVSLSMHQCTGKNSPGKGKVQIEQVQLDNVAKTFDQDGNVSEGINVTCEVEHIETYLGKAKQSGIDSLIIPIRDNKVVQALVDSGYTLHRPYKTEGKYLIFINKKDKGELLTTPSLFSYNQQNENSVPIKPHLLCYNKQAIRQQINYFTLLKPTDRTLFCVHKHSGKRKAFF